MMRKKKSRLGLFLTIFLPSILGLIIIVCAVDAYVVNTLTHPFPKKKINPKAPDDWGKVRPLYWEEVSWDSQSSSFKGWVFVYGSGAPGILLTHGFNGNRQDLIDLAYRLWERGYNVMICDLRSHGENTAEISTLGALEKSDVAAAMKKFKDLKYNKDTGKVGNTGDPLVDPQNVGIYGIDVSAFAALMVAADDDTIKGVVVDAPAFSVPDYVRTRMKQVYKTDSELACSLVDKGMEYYLPKYDVGSALSAIAKYKGKGKKVMVIIGNDAGPYKNSAKKVFDQVGPTDGRMYTPTLSRLTALYKEAADEYNGSVCDFFRNEALPPPAPAAPTDATQQPGAPGAPGAPGTTPAPGTAKPGTPPPGPQSAVKQASPAAPAKK
ncbi:MAG: hypothetical protein K1Y36_20275 [Blastocatellia bacterium]|nr:hypothetical protein [Blastocatellia bacterium]